MKTSKITMLLTGGLTGLLMLSQSLMAQDVKTEVRKTGSFTAISNHCSADILLSQGPETLVKVEADAKAIDKIETTVENGELRIDIKGTIMNAKVLRVFVTSPSITKISLNGSGDLEGMNLIKAADLVVSINGSGDVDVDLDATNFEGRINGSGDMKVEGIRGSFKLDVNGSGDFSGKDLQLASSDITNHGSGDIKLTGSSVITTIKSNSSGDINTSGLKSDKVSAECHGSADIYVFAATSLDVRSNSSGDIYYKGDPKTKTVSLKGSGELHQMDNK
jgi:hypothetical protein